MTVTKAPGRGRDASVCSRTSHFSEVVPRVRRRAGAAYALTLCTLVVACGGGGGGGSGPTATYSVVASVSGLTGSGLTLSLNGGAPVPASNGSVTLSPALANGATYAVTVVGTPVDPTQSCTVSSATGQISGANATGIEVVCVVSAASAQTAAQLSLDSSVPATIQSSIAKVITPSGSGSLSSWIPIDLTGPDGDTFAFAVDANGKVVMATMVGSSQATLSADSTALALSRLLTNDVSTKLSAAEIESNIRAAAGYAALVTVIDADLKAGTRPLSDAALAPQLLSVAQSTAAAMIAYSGAAPVVKTALNPPPLTSLPYTILAAATGKPYLEMKQLSPISDGQISISSSMPIPWSVSTTLADGTPIESGLLTASGALGGGGLIALKMANSPFNVLVTQDAASLNSIAADFLLGLTNGSLKALSPWTGCTTAVLAPFLKSNIGAFVTKVPYAQFVTTTVTNYQSDAVGIVKACNPALTQALQDSAVALLRTTTTTMEEVLLNLKAATSLPVAVATALGGMLNESYWGQYYWDTTYPVGVCAAVDFSVASCTASFTFNPTSLLLAPGASVPVALTGLDLQSNPTVLPGDLAIVASDTTLITLTGTSNFTATAASSLAMSPAVTYVDVTDPATGATNAPNPPTSSFQVTTVWPTLMPSAPAFTSGPAPQTLTVTLTGPNGISACGISVIEPCLSLPDGIKWSTDKQSPSFAKVTVAGPAGTWTIPANAATDTVQINATDGNGNTYGPATITVIPAAPTVTLTANPASLTSGESSTLTWSSTNATSCAAAWTTGTAPSGTASTGPLTATATYSMTCSDANGNVSAPASATVTVVPVITYGYYLVFQEVPCTGSLTASFSINGVSIASATFAGPSDCSVAQINGETIGPITFALPPMQQGATQNTATITWSGVAYTPPGGRASDGQVIAEVDKYVNGVLAGNFFSVASTFYVLSGTTTLIF
jgi:hypothetical protein